MRAKKHLGQNFLRDTSVISRIVDALDIGASDTVLEIGPGMGALTGDLLERAARVIALEFDRDVMAYLRDRFASVGNLSLLQADALTVDLASVIPDSPVKLAANLPYYISTPILQRLAEERSRFSSMVLMLQKEVVDRIMAKPGSSERGYLTVLIENVFDTERLFDVPPEAFEPRPKVDSSVVRLSPKAELIPVRELENLLAIAFRQKRKTIANNLKGSFTQAAEILESVKIDPKRRAETLTLSEWAALASALK